VRLDQVNQAYQDTNDGKNIRGVIIHEHSCRPAAEVQSGVVVEPRSVQREH